MTRKYVKNCFVICLAMCTFLLSESKNNALGASMNKVYHGTLNIVMATPDALLAATDSRATIMNRQSVVGREDTHQKLFIIPGDVLVTIASYNRVTLPNAPEFTAPAAAIILDYIDKLQSHKRVPQYEEVLSELTHLLTFHLTSVANINLWSQGSVSPNSYLFQMIVAGKRDGTFIMAKVTLSLTLNRTPEGRVYVTSHTSDIVQKKVSSLSYLTAGWDSVARQILVKAKGAPTKQEMEDYIRDAMQKTSAANEGVGGAIQQATLSEHGLSVSIPSYPRPAGPTVRYGMFVGGGFAHAKIAVASDAPFLFITTSFEDTGVILDGNYFYGAHLKACKIFVNRNAFTFDKTNTIENCNLYVGRLVDKTAVKYKQLSSRFALQNIYYERESKESAIDKSLPAEK
jgi:hypothetical protein